MLAIPSLCTFLAGLLAAALVADCAATRPINARVDKLDTSSGYRYTTREQFSDDSSDTILILAFSGGGTRAAAFSYGVLEQLKRTEVTVSGRRTTMLEQIDIVTGASGGSFTALAFALYGDKLFDIYEAALLKRDVQSELIKRVLSPGNWGNLAAQLYDEILFHDATFADLAKKPGPWAMVTATDISTGSRLAFVQPEFDVICSDVGSVPLSRAAVASAAVPFALSPVTINNYGGTCGFREPRWARAMDDPNNRARPAGRALQMLREMRSFENGAERPYIHLVDGRVADNLGVRGILGALEQLELSAGYQRALRINTVCRIAVLVVGSLSDPETDWDRHESPPNGVQILVKATAVPIHRYSYDAVELLEDTPARWKMARDLRATGAFANAGNSSLDRAAANVPNVDIFAIDVSFDAIDDANERHYLKDQPTSFVLPPEAVDRLRAAAGNALRASPDFQRLVYEMSHSKPPESVTPPIEVR